MTDEDTAAEMRRLADIFVAEFGDAGGVRTVGVDFDFCRDAAESLDALIDMYLDTTPDDVETDAMIRMVAAYLGEVVVRAGKGSWTYNKKRSAAALLLGTERRWESYPMNTVAKKMEAGPEFELRTVLHTYLGGGPSTST